MALLKLVQLIRLKLVGGLIPPNFKIIYYGKTLEINIG